MRRAPRTGSAGIWRRSTWATLPASLGSIPTRNCPKVLPGSHIRTTRGPGLIAVMMPNDTTVDDENWAKYRCSVEDVEKETNLTFFDKASDDIVGPRKKKVDKLKIPKLPKEH